MATTADRPRVSLTGLALAAGGCTRGVGAIASRTGVAGPVVVVGLVLAVLLAGTLGGEHWSLYGPIQFGHSFAAVTHPPHGAPVQSPFGYDGQFYWIQAQDPLLLRHATVLDMARYHPDFLQRLAYPGLAFVLALGQRAALPAGLLGVDVLSVLGITAGFAIVMRRWGRSPWWALAVGLTPGLLMPVLRDLTDPLATAAMLGGLLAWERRRRWWAGALLATATLAREPMIVAVAGVAADSAAQAWRARGDRAAVGRALRAAWPVAAVPVGVFVAWQAYIRLRYDPAAAVGGGGPLTPTPNLRLFGSFVAELHRTLRQDSAVAAAWDITYMALVLCAITGSLLVLRRGITAAGVTAVLLAAMLPVVYFDDEWSISRYGAPLFAALLLTGLQRRSRPAVAVAVAAAAMTPLVPLMIAGI